MPGQNRSVKPGGELDVPTLTFGDTVRLLMHYGGFPEPFLAQSDRTLRRWQKGRIELFFREDVRDLERVQDMSLLETLADLLPERVGAPLSLNSMREDLEVSHRSVSRWMEILDRLYFVFHVRPFATKAVRSLRRMPKVYMWDTTLVADQGARFENLVALHLLKFCNYLEDEGGYRVSLQYLRDRTGREVDFLVTLDRRPWFAVEAKLTDQTIAPSLRYFAERLNIPFAYQITLEGTRDFVHDGIRCLPASRFFGALI